MIKNVGGWCLLTLLGSAWADGAQLPPEVLLDQLLLRTERLIEADDLDAAVEAMDEGFALAAEHELELPPNFRIKQAQTEFAVGLLAAAKESVTAYLAVASREAESYLNAVELLEDVDRILERRDAPECLPQPEGSACWTETASHPGCYVWNPNPQPDETATWTGECSAGFAQGPGTLTWNHPEGSQEHEAGRRFGQPHGPSVVRDSEGWVDEGSHRFGKRHGAWIERTADGAVLEGPYVDGEENGHWVLWFPDGQVEEGPFTRGKRNGQWVQRFASGVVAEGPYVDGEENGRWVITEADGGIGERLYADGEKNGQWVERFANGNVAEGPYVEGKRSGQWVWTYRDRQVESGPYADDERHGRWRIAFPDGEVTYVEFVRGIRQEP